MFAGLTKNPKLCFLTSPSAYAMPEGLDYERLEPSSWKQEDAR